MKQKKSRLPGTRLLLITPAVFLFLLFQGCKKDPAEMKQVDIQLVAEGLVSPVGVVSAGQEDKRLFIIDQIGKIWIIDKDGNKLHWPPSLVL